MDPGHLDDRCKPLTSLEDEGLVAQHIVARATGYECWRKCPLKFLLQHRMGLVPRTRGYNEYNALDLGTWFHKSLEGRLRGFTEGGNPDEIRARSSALVQAEYATWVDMKIQEAKELNLPPLTAEDIRAVWATASVGVAWADACWALKPLDLVKYKPIEIEKNTTVNFGGNKNNIGGTRNDALLYDEERNELWVLDWKTTRKTPSARASVLTREFRTLFYLDVLHSRLSAGELAPEVPADTKIAGFINYIFQKPAIRIKKTTENKLGRDKALEEYLGRCAEWVASKGEFDKNETPLVVSYTRVHPDAYLEKGVYTDQRDKFLLACRVRPSLGEFPPNYSVLLESFSPDRLDPYAPFYLLPVERWPHIAREGFLVNHRSSEMLDFVTLDNE